MVKELEINSHARFLAVGGIARSLKLDLWTRSASVSWRHWDRESHDRELQSKQVVERPRIASSQTRIATLSRGKNESWTTQETCLVQWWMAWDWRWATSDKFEILQIPFKGSS